MPRKRATPKPGPFLHVTLQRHDTDCVVACLAMYCGVPYEAALLAIGKESIFWNGTSVKLLMEAAETLRCPLQEETTFDLDEDTGILWVGYRKGADHVVVLHEGMVIDTDGMLWDARDYMKAKRAKVKALFTRRD